MALADFLRRLFRSSSGPIVAVPPAKTRQPAPTTRPRTVGSPPAAATRKPAIATAPPRQQMAPRRSPKRTPRQPGRWIPAGVPVQVHDRTIEGGMVYVGSGLRSASGVMIEPALIDPSLPVTWHDPNLETVDLDYWPRYDSLTSLPRGRYLNWLIEGRSDPSVPIGFVFLYFYGLERRLLFDLKLGGASPVDAEVGMIAAEIERLRAIYADQGSFDHYSRGLLDLITVATNADEEGDPPTTADLEPRRGQGVPLAVSLALGRRSAAGKPIPADWALAFLRSHPDTKLRTPARRCAAEFDDLFRHLYVERHGEGMVIRPPKRRLAFSYRPASAGFGGSFEAKLNLPDVTTIVGPIRQLNDIAEATHDQLDAYSRYLGRNPDGRGTTHAGGLLPDALLAAHGGETIAGIRAWAERAISARTHTTITIDDVVAGWDPQRTAKLARADAVALTSLLSKFGVGMEPDVRFGSSTPKPGSEVVLFPLSDGAPAAPSSAYSAAALLVRLAAAVSAADGSVSEAERRHLTEHLESALGLDGDECARLEAHLVWLGQTARGSLAGVRKRLEALDADQRAGIGDFLIGVAAADDQVTPEEVTTLTKIFALLGLDEGDVYRRLHTLGSDEPVTVQTPSGPPTRWAIPPQGAPVGAVQLDERKVQERLADTAAVGALLRGIFTDEDDERNVPEPTPPPAADGDEDAGAPTIGGLDQAHSDLARALSTQAEWERAAAETLADSFGLPLLDGAIEKINDASFDACDEPLVEGDDPLEINQYATQELLG